jgi:hypothetical protein
MFRCCPWSTSAAAGESATFLCWQPTKPTLDGLLAQAGGLRQFNSDARSRRTWMRQMLMGEVRHPKLISYGITNVPAPSATKIQGARSALPWFGHSVLCRPNATVAWNIGHLQQFANIVFDVLIWILGFRFAVLCFAGTFPHCRVDLSSSTTLGQSRT